MYEEYDFLTRSRLTHFMREIAEVCRKHQFSLAHESQTGSFLIHPHNFEDEKSILAARPEKLTLREITGFEEIFGDK